MGQKYKQENGQAKFAFSSREKLLCVIGQIIQASAIVYRLKYQSKSKQRADLVGFVMHCGSLHKKYNAVPSDH